MAYGLNCQCEKCGYTASGIVFGTYRSPGSYMMPVLNQVENMVESINLVNNPPAYNDTLVPYTSKKLKSWIRTLFKGKKLRQSSEYINCYHNYCPKCKSYNLSFDLDYLAD